VFRSSELLSFAVRRDGRATGVTSERPLPIPVPSFFLSYNCRSLTPSLLNLILLHSIIPSLVLPSPLC
jgi:hypothetical protein